MYLFSECWRARKEWFELDKNLFLILALNAIIFTGCEREQSEPVNQVAPVAPVVSTLEASEHTLTSVIVRSRIEENGGAEISEAGICWRNDTAAPTVLGLKKQAYVKMGDYSIELSVSPSRTYTVRAYALNSVGIAYGECITFTTDSLPPPPPPEPRLAQISNGTMLRRTSNSADFKATVIDSGFCVINEIGVCWSKTGIPDINDYRQIISNPKVGEFTISAPDLEMLTDYNARVYVTNIVGTNYGGPISFCTYDSVVDADGNVYYGVKIGSQVWLTENLKTTHFNNGDAINYVTDDSEWASHANPAYCWYDNDESRADKGFGALYNLKVVLDDRGVAPQGYRLPSKEDVMIFGEYFGIDEIIYDGGGIAVYYNYNGGSSIRSKHIWAPLLRGNNSTGFNAIPSGFRFRDGDYLEGHMRAEWWTTTPEIPGYYWTFYTGGEVANNYITMGPNPRDSGRAIRCIKN